VYLRDSEEIGEDCEAACKDTARPY